MAQRGPLSPRTVFRLRGALTLWALGWMLVACSRPVPFDPPELEGPPVTLSVPGYGELAAKLESGELVDVCVCGGSITYGVVGTDEAGVVDTHAGWIHVFMEGLLERYPNVRWVNAAVSATDSTFGLMRVRDDVEPNDFDHWFDACDLLIWEYVVNDHFGAYNAVDSNGFSTTDHLADLSLARRITRFASLADDYREAGGVGALYMLGATRRGYDPLEPPHDPTDEDDAADTNFGFDRSRLIARVMTQRYAIPFFDTAARALSDPVLGDAQMFYDTDAPGNDSHPSRDGHRAMGVAALAHFLEVLASGRDTFTAPNDYAIPDVTPSPTRVRSFWVGEPPLDEPPPGWEVRQRSRHGSAAFDRGGRLVLDFVGQGDPESYPLDLSGLDLEGARQVVLVTERRNVKSRVTNARVRVDINSGEYVRLLAWPLVKGDRYGLLRSAATLTGLPAEIETFELTVIGPVLPRRKIYFATHGVLIGR